MDIRNVSSSAAKAAVFAMLTTTLAAGCAWGEHHPIHNAADVSPDPQDVAGAAVDPIPTKIANQPKARKNVVQTKCAAIPGGWGAQGTATNPGKIPVTYKIVVHFTTTRATTLAYAETLVPVEPGKTVTWKADKRFQAQKKMLCPMPGISTTS